MTSALAPRLDQIYALAQPAPPQALARYRASADRYQRQARADSTWRSYTASWNLARRFCAAHGVAAAPMAPATARILFAWMGDQAYSRSYINSMAVVLRLVHYWLGADDPRADPDVLETLQGVMRVAGALPVHRKLALTSEELVASLLAIDDPQERAVLVLTFGYALRRSETVALNIPDLEFDEDGLTVTVRKSKTDQESLGERVYLKRGKRCCPVAAVEAWLTLVAKSQGPVFRHCDGATITARRLSSRTVARWTQRAGARIGLDPTLIGAHSLRAGCTTELLLGRVPEPEVCKHTRHASIDSLLAYWRPRGKARVDITEALRL